MSTKQIIERERRWAPWAGAAGIAALVAFIGFVVVNASSEAATADTVLLQLLAFQDSGSGFLAAQALQAIALTSVGVVTYFLFRAAQARSEEVNKAMVGFPIMFPVLFLIATAGYVISFSSISDDVAALPEQQVSSDARALERFTDLVENDPGEIDEVIFLTGIDVIEYEPAGDAAIAVSYDDADEEDLTSSVEETEIDASAISTEEAIPGELQTQQFVEDSGSFGTFIALRSTNSLAPGLLVLPATLALIIGVFYTSRWALRTGLQTRFWGTFGMAGSIAVILLGPLGPLLWAFNGGLAMAGWPRALQPRAWLTGEPEPPQPFGAKPEPEGGEQPLPPEDGVRRKRKQRR